MHANVSAIKCFQNNEMEWFYRYHMRRIPVGAPAVYFTIGSWWHEVQAFGLEKPRESMADFASNLLLKYILDSRLNGASDAYVTRLEADATRLISLIPFIPKRFYLTDIHEIETVIQAPLPDSDHTFFGRPDAVVEYAGKFWHLQHKALSDRTSMAVYVASRSIDLHELMYAFLICTKMEIPLSMYGGTLMNITRKLSMKAIKERPNEAFVQEIIPIQERHILHAIRDVKEIMSRMALIQNGSVIPILNRDAVTNRYGNVLSDYFDVYTERISIHDDTFFKTAPVAQEGEILGDDAE